MKANPICENCPLFDCYLTEKSQEFIDFGTLDKSRHPNNCCKFLSNNGSCPHDKNVDLLTS
jgi:hypothetical protein